MILTIVIEHQGLRVYKVYINDDTDLTLTYFTARSNLIPSLVISLLCCM